MAWIESHQALQHHRKTLGLARRLGISIPTAIGHLHCFWWWCLDNAPYGHLTDCEVADIAEVAMWEGDPGMFVDALIRCGWLDHDENGGLYVHDWHEYGGKLGRKRDENAQRQRAYRERLQQRNANVTQEGSRYVTQGVDGDVTVTSRIHNSDVTRQRRVEKSREENNTEDPKRLSFDADAPNVSASAPVKRQRHFTETPDFLRFYEAYPRHEARQDACKAWLALAPTAELVQTILDAVARRLPEWRAGDPRFIPLPATWLRGSRWEDAPSPPDSRAQRNGSGGMGSLQDYADEEYAAVERMKAAGEWIDG
jgi:hypothetical protein